MAAVHLHPFFATPPLAWWIPTPTPGLYLYPHALSAGTSFILSFITNRSPGSWNFSTFQVLLQILVQLLRDFLKAALGHFSAPPPHLPRVQQWDVKVNRKKRLPSSVHRRWDPQRSWWRAESAGDFGNTTHRGGAGFAGTVYTNLKQKETHI